MPDGIKGGVVMIQIIDPSMPDGISDDELNSAESLNNQIEAAEALGDVAEVNRLKELQNAI